ncbi:MAG TPA: hypothetical protein VES42_29000, partial [Pilimelia sp.]|nr:hypothetical protein [Pilimelia sp.]
MPTGPEAALPAPRLHAVLAAVRAMNAATDDAFLPTVLRAAADLLPCDSVAYHELDTRGPAPRERRQLVEPRYAGRGAPVEAYHRHLAQHPVFAALAGDPLATGTCVALSDVVAAAGFRRLPLYTEYYRHRRIADQLVAVIGGSPGRTASLVVNRSRRGFSPADRAVLRLFLPHLQQALRHRARVARLGRAAAGPDA